MSESFAGAETSVARLIRAARAGEREPLERLLSLYRNYLRLLAEVSLDGGLRAKADPSDMVQDAVLKAFQGFPEFRGETEGELVAWLKRILARGLADLNRRYRQNEGRAVGRERSLEAMIERSSQALQALPAAGASPSAHAQQRETAVLVADALSALPPDDHEVIVLRSLQELDWSEVGRRMSRSAEAARALWGRAFQRLGALVEGRQWLSG